MTPSGNPFDDVGQPPRLPDFVDPDEVRPDAGEIVRAWGADEPAAGPRAGSPARAADPSGGRRASRAGRGAPTGQGRGKKHLSWAEKQARREKRAEARREAEAAEREKDPMGFAREIVLRQLTVAPRSRHQLLEKLREKDVADDVAEAVLDRMEDVGLVDDEAYAGMLVRSQVASRGLARPALKRELRRKGLDDETADAALEQVSDEAERETALALARKKRASMSRLEPDVRRRRLAGLLARKGYASGLVWSVVKEVEGEWPEGANEGPAS